jgi:hypothetical protein
MCELLSNRYLYIVNKKKVKSIRIIDNTNHLDQIMPSIWRCTAQNNIKYILQKFVVDE